MTEYKATFIRIPKPPNGVQTQPVEPGKRIPDADIKIEPCTPDDATIIAEGLYLCFSETFWAKREPPSRRPEHTVRVQRLAKRILPSLLDSRMEWIKAVIISTGTIAGVAGWITPGTPVHTHFRSSAVEFYGWKEKMGWSDAEVAEMWEAIDDKEWSGEIAGDDERRRAILGDEPHWHLAPLFTWPEYQGRGVGKKLLTWAVERADRMEPPTPMYLESAPTARAVYMNSGFVPQGGSSMLRRGPAIVRGLDDEEKKEDVGVEKAQEVNVDLVAKEMEAELAS